MGNTDSGNPIVLVFDCVSLGTHEIQTTDGLKLKDVLKRLSKRINTSVSKIGDVKYNYSPLDKNRTISELGLKSGSVMLVNFKN